MHNTKQKSVLLKNKSFRLELTEKIEEKRRGCDNEGCIYQHTTTSFGMETITDSCVNALVALSNSSSHRNKGMA